MPACRQHVQTDVTVDVTISHTHTDILQDASIADQLLMQWPLAQMLLALHHAGDSSTMHTWSGTCAHMKEHYIYEYRHQQPQTLPEILLGLKTSYRFIHAALSSSCIFCSASSSSAAYLSSPARHAWYIWSAYFAASVVHKQLLQSLQCCAERQKHASHLSILPGIERGTDLHALT